MSGSGEYADPGRNYPDNEGASEPDPAPTLADPNRSASEALPSPPGTTQDAAVMDQHSASIDDKIDGIVAQTRVDVADKPHERIVDVLRQRFDDAGISADDVLLDDLAKKVADG